MDGQRCLEIRGVGMKTRDKVYEFICDFYNRNGYSPTIREVGDAVGLSSSSTVHGHVNRLIQEGKLAKKDSSPRTLVSFGSQTNDSMLGSVVRGKVIKVDEQGCVEEIKVGDRIYQLVL